MVESRRNVRIFTKGYSALLVAQFFGACNDNVLKQLIALQVVGGIWRDQMGAGGQGIITLIFTLPFLLFSGWSGQIADRFSKQRLSVWVKIAEICLAFAAMAALWLGSLWLAVGTLLLLALQSTVFGPAKYGMIPELFPEEGLSRANGVLNMLTNIAIIIGVIIGGQLSDAYPSRKLLPGFIMLVVALVGYSASLFIPKLPARDPSVKPTPNPFKPYVETIVIMARRRALLITAIGWGFFGFLGVMVIQALLDFKILLSLTDRETSYLNIPLIVGGGVGSVLAGYLSRDKVRLGLVPIGALGMTICLALLGTLELTAVFVVTSLIFLGFFSGFYVVPLQALLQARSPLNLRGRIQGTTALLDFALIALGGGLYWLLRGKLEVGVQNMLFLCSIITLVVASYIFWDLRKYLGQRVKTMLDIK